MAINKSEIKTTALDNYIAALKSLYGSDAIDPVEADIRNGQSKLIDAIIDAIIDEIITNGEVETSVPATCDLPCTGILDSSGLPCTGSTKGSGGIS
jgi:hypothetical protein